MHRERRSAARQTGTSATALACLLVVVGCGRIYFEPLTLAEDDAGDSGDGSGQPRGLDPSSGDAAVGNNASVDAGAYTDGDPGDAASMDGADDAAPTCTVMCSNDHGTATCSDDVCNLTCSMGYDDCDGDSDNGCETDLLNDPLHCGTCTNACNTDLVCADGMCQASPCADGFGECDGDLSQSCETDLTTNVDHCGFCGNACSIDHGSPACVDEDCAIASCDPGYDDCDGDPTTGCETELATAAAHCGACSDPCTNDHGTTSCVGGTCVPSCSAGYDDCDGDPRNGCEADLTNTAHCGVCGNACSSTGDGTPVCDGGSCNTLCDLSGTFALKTTHVGSWPGNIYLTGDSGTFEFWMRVDVDHFDNTLNLNVVECGRTIPPVSPALLSEDYFYSYADSLFDSGNVPSSAGMATLSDSLLGASFSLPPVAMLLGLTMSDPINDPWPSQASAIPSGDRIDMDNNGKPGVDSLYANSGGYDYPRTSDSLFSYNRTDVTYAASRVVFSLDGSLDDCSSAQGSVTFTHLESRVFGCKLAGSSSDCSATEASFMDDRAVDFSLPASGSFELLKIADGAACPAVRAALP